MRRLTHVVKGCLLDDEGSQARNKSRSIGLTKSKKYILEIHTKGVSIVVIFLARPKLKKRLWLHKTGYGSFLFRLVNFSLTNKKRNSGQAKKTHPLRKKGDIAMTMKSSLIRLVAFLKTGTKTMH